MLSRVPAPVLAAALCSIVFVTDGWTAAIGRDQLERRLLDTCVYRQFEVKDVNRSRMVEDCRCATRTALGTIEGTEFKEPRSGGLTGPQDQALKAGIAACFKAR